MPLLRRRRDDEPFVASPLRDNWYQSASYWPSSFALVTTVDENGETNIGPYQLTFPFEVITGRSLLLISRQNSNTEQNIRRTGEFVVNLADEGTANAMHLTGTELPETDSEFSAYGLTPAPAKLVQHPRIAEAAASFECRLERRITFGPQREMVIGEILLIHAREGIIDPVTKRISEELYRPVGRLFADRYCTTRQRFNLPGEPPR